MLLWTVALVAILLGTGLAALTWGPNWARDRIAGYVGQVLGREVGVSRIEVSPFAGRLVFDGIRVASLEPGKPMLAIERATVEVDAWSLARGRVVIRGVRLDAPAARVVRLEPTRFDFSEVLDRFANRPPSQHKTDWRVDHIGITGGRIEFDDRVARTRIAIDALGLDARGLSNEGHRADDPATVESRFALQGRPVTATVRATPFSATPVFAGTLKVDAIPLGLLLPYLPMPADVRPKGGTLDLDVGATWRSAVARPGTLETSGQVHLNDLSVHDAAGRERVAAKRLAVTMAPSMPLGGAIHLGEIALRAPRLELARTSQGRLDWPAAGAAPTGTAAAAAAPTNTAAPTNIAAPTSTAAPTGTGATSGHGSPHGTARAVPRSLRIDAIRIDEGSLAWQDAALPAPLDLRVTPLSLALKAIEIADLERPAEIRGSGRMDATVDGAATLSADLSLDGTGGRAAIELGGIDVARYAPLAGPALRATVEQGTLGGRATVGWRGGADGWTVADAGATLAGLQLLKDGRRPMSIDRFDVDGVVVDPAARSVRIGSAKLDGARLQLVRGKDGRFDIQDWYVAGPPRSPPAGAEPRPAGASDAHGPWAVQVAEAQIGRLELDYDDLRLPPERKLPRLTLSAKASNLSPDLSQSVPFEAMAALADGSRLSALGTVRPAPLALDARLRLQRLTVTHFEPYLAPYVNATLASGQLWSSGRLRVSSGTDGALERIGFDGEFSANDFRAIDQISSEDFLRWTALAMPSIKVDWRPSRPADSLVEIGDVAFYDFYARIILTPEGRLNLSDLLADPSRRGRDARSLTRAEGGGTSPGPTPAREPARISDDLERQVATGYAEPRRADPGSRRTATLPPGAAGPRPTIRVGTVRIAGGNVNFSDLFIRPNYTANLTQLTGSIDAIASDRTEPSDVLITGRVDDDTPLEISGKINPLAVARFVDLRAVARGFELPKLSPYSGRWAGYAIQKGKLTADVRYRIQGDQLQAENKLTINQLTFGDKVDSPNATSLPVRLAVSLLKDRYGNIDLDLPISGTISDPQFSVGGLLWRAIGNLVTRVVSAPFNFLASLVGADAGAGAQLSHIEFPAGGVAIDDDDRKRLDGLARAMESRPEMTLEIAGIGDPIADRSAMQRERLDRTLKATKLAQMRRDDPRAELPPLTQVAIDETERPVLLERAWRDAKLDAGVAGKAPSSDEIERQLIARTQVATEEVRQIAQLRAQAAHDYLRTVHGIGDERLYLLAPRVAEDDGTLPPRRVEFSVR